MLKFKKGDMCCITANTGGHEFKEGEIVTIVELFEEPKDTTCEHYKAAANGDFWYVDDSELEIYNPNIGKTLL